MITLDKAKKSKAYKIVGFGSASDGISRRFMELGFSKGEKLKIVSTSLLRKVFLIEVRGCQLSVRANLLCRVFVDDQNKNFVGKGVK